MSESEDDSVCASVESFFAVMSVVLFPANTVMEEQSKTALNVILKNPFFSVIHNRHNPFFYGGLSKAAVHN